MTNCDRSKFSGNDLARIILYKVAEYWENFGLDDVSINGSYSIIQFSSLQDFIKTMTNTDIKFLFFTANNERALIYTNDIKGVSYDKNFVKVFLEGKYDLVLKDG